MFNTLVSECTVVVVDPDHPRFGQTAQLTAHDWKEYGTLFLEFPDGGKERLHDDLMSDDANLPQARILRTAESHEILALQRGLPAVREQLKVIAVVAENTALPQELRLCAKQCFVKAFESAALLAPATA